MSKLTARRTTRPSQADPDNNTPPPDAPENAAPSESETSAPVDLVQPEVSAADARQWAEEQRIEEILQSEGEGTTIEVHRRQPSGRWALIDCVELGDWHATTKKAFGGGDYKGRVRRADGTFGPAFHFYIDRSVKPVGSEPRPSAHDISQAQERVTASQHEGMTPMLVQMLQMQREQTALMVQQMQESAKTQVAIITAALSRPPPPGPSEKLMEILATKALAPAAPALDLDRMISAVVKLRNIAQAAPSDGDERERSPDLLDRIVGALPSIVRMLGSVQLAVPDPTPVAPRRIERHVETNATPPAPTTETASPDPEPGPPPVAPTGGAPVVDAAAQNRAALASFLPQIIVMADAGTPPEQVAAAIVEAVPKDAMEALLDLLDRDDYLAILADAHDGVMLRSPFFVDLREELLTQAEEKEEA